MKKIISLMLAGVFVLTATAPAYAQGELTKGEYAQILLETAKPYNPSLKMEDIIKGDGSGQEENKLVTKAEALVMLKRAYGNLPTLSGDLKRTAPESGTYTDLPFWSKTDIEALSKAGVLSEPVGGAIGATEYIDKDYADTMSGRMYRLFGSDPKDDFYTTVNRKFLNDSVIEEGSAEASVFYDVNDDISGDLIEILAEIVKSNHVKGSAEQKIKDFCATAADKKTREELGISPIEPYLEKIREAKTDKELYQVALDLAEDTTLDLLFGFSVTSELEDKTKYVPVFDTYVPTLPLSNYYEGSEMIEDFRKYMIKAFIMGGNDTETAKEKADLVIDFETELAKYSAPNEEFVEIENNFNYYTMKDLQGYFKSVDVKAVADVHGFNIDKKIVIVDPEQMKFYASYFDGEHTELLKALAEISMIAYYSDLLTEDFTMLDNELTEVIYGFNPENTILTNAFNSTFSLMSDYLGEIYYKNNFSEEEEEKVRDIVNSIKDSYLERLKANTWLSEETKEEAIKKLETLEVVIGIPDDGTDFIKDIDIKGPSEGGTYIENINNVLKANDKIIADLLSGDYTINEISFSAYEVNAMYRPDYNTIILPAGILREPIYSSEDSYEETYGKIGYIIGHEMSHAFDTNGAKYDENGNYKNWWTKVDYANFSKLSKKVEEYYDGAEAATGLTVNGKLTLDENIADMVGVEAALDALKTKVEKPDYEKFFESFAYISRYTITRDTLKYDLEEDVHSPCYIRVNYSVKNTDEFQETYNVEEQDGMYVSPSDRIEIW